MYTKDLSNVTFLPQIPMKRFNLPSYIVGVITGAVILVLVFSVKPFLNPSQKTPFPSDRMFDGQERGESRREGMRSLEGDMMNEERLQSMADQFGITVEELQTEMDSGKTLPEIAEEHGVELQSPRGMPGGDRLGMPQSGTGTSEIPDSPEEPSDTESSE